MFRAAPWFCALLVLSLAASAAMADAVPLVVGGFEAESTHATDFAAEGDIGVLVTKRRAGAELYVLDLRNPAQPALLGTLDVDAHLKAVVLGGHFAYLATSSKDRELLVVDLSDPAQPRIVGSYDAPLAREAHSLALRGSVLFLGSRRVSSPRWHELYAFDVSAPSTPFLLDSIDVGGSVNGLALDGDVLYAATSQNAKELIAFDVSVPTNIVELASLDLPGSANAQGVAVDRHGVYVARKSRTESFSVIDKNSLAVTSRMALGSRINKVRVYRDRAYLAAAGSGRGLKIVDIANPSNPKMVHDLRTDGSAGGVQIQPPFTYLSTTGRAPDLVVVNTEALLRPNIVVVYTDDQHWSSVDFMPRLQELAARGVVFRQSFVTTPLCGPSRASFLTGLYTHNHGALINVDYIGRRGGVGSDESTLATWLQSAGYRTGFFGKYVNGYNPHCAGGLCEVPPGWDDWQTILDGHYFNYLISNNGVVESFGDQPSEYSTDVLAQKTLDFIARDDRRPFLAVLSTNAPHSDGSGILVTPAPRHDGALSGIAPWRPPNYDEEDLSDKPPSFFGGLPRAADVIAGTISYGDLVDAVRQDQQEALLAVDEALQSVVELLATLGEDQDTLVIFTSDNGFNWGEHRLWIGKSFPHEQSIRVPFVASYPRLIEAGRVDDVSMVLNIDIGPTIAALAGVTPTSGVDGASLVPLFKNDPAVDWRNDFLIENYGSFSFSGRAVYQAIRHQSFMYSYYVEPGEDEMYDLASDPEEMQSQACNPSFDGDRLFLQQRIGQLVTNPSLAITFLPSAHCN